MTGAFPSTIVTEEHLDKLNGHLKNLDTAINEANLAVQAGLQPPATLQRLQDLKARVMKVKAVYFPGR